MALVHIDAAAPIGLQAQIREQLVQAILGGTLAAGSRLPSSRQLADDLAVARNTVSLAYQELVAEGWLESRQRSGVFVAGKLLEGRVALAGRQARRTPDSAGPSRFAALTGAPTATPTHRVPENWVQHPYPFLDGRCDDELLALPAWREAGRLAMGGAEVARWRHGHSGGDDPMLLEELCSKVLPRRGIHTHPDALLITLGSRHACSLLSAALAGPGLAVGVEEPGPPALRALLQAQGASVRPLGVDADGLLPDAALTQVRLACTTPNMQVPTGVTMPLARREALLAAADRHDVLLLELDPVGDLCQPQAALPALRALDTAGRVVHVVELALGLAPGVRLAVVVADADLVVRLRDLRRASGTEPPLADQHTLAHLVALGQWDSSLARQRQILDARRTALGDALNHYLPGAVEVTPAPGATTWWVNGPDGLDATRLARDAAARGVLVEPVGAYHGFSTAPAHCFRMGFTSLPAAHIRPGVQVLATGIRDQVQGRTETLEDTAGKRLSGRALQRTLGGATLLLTTVYGEPLAITLHRDGRMTGRAGFHGEEQDDGHWWVEDDLWCRQWQTWSYAEALRFHTVLDGHQVKWFQPNGRLIDVAVLHATGNGT